MASKLDQLREMTVVVADTGDLEAVRRLRPQDCTTNPSLVLKAIGSPAMEEHVARAVAEGRAAEDPVGRIATILTVGLGAELAGIVPGRVSTEVDARLSFDTEGSVRRAREIVDEYARLGVGRERVLIKLASTWEGVRACERLAREGIDCNMTLLFSLAQARACADAGAWLISPFVGRITDWYSKKEGRSFGPEEDPGVASVRRIYDHYKRHGIATVVMGASFRNTGQIEALAGCDRLTISPDLLDRLAADEGPLARALEPVAAEAEPEPIAEAEFRWEMNEDAMATEKLAEGIRNFHADALKLEALIRDRLAA
ncbi:transaldolase [Rubellimicrobium sp. CFH 75288]|uniref:transaldolase n=1 Tax=Rubellimicrobium sp. CFH 75288 TaxID=2697034 RepID=UPI00141243D8|nr:transaldolase [Rubellimicrobium sp. CFH 75288]NAZ37261.1 transaldolase [Rubellimicrobium sp. CFH 75288]